MDVHPLGGRRGDAREIAGGEIRGRCRLRSHLPHALVDGKVVIDEAVGEPVASEAPVEAHALDEAARAPEIAGARGRLGEIM